MSLRTSRREGSPERPSETPLLRQPLPLSFTKETARKVIPGTSLMVYSNASFTLLVTEPNFARTELVK
ncbi:hypothetical protein SESBI_11209 [Sesbania bispinosa]|nr:hypothetical protein SESBI_11209 [Sesbania bispinosa]